MTYNVATSLEEGDNTSIEELDLMVRTYNCLKRSDINTVGQLLAMSKHELLGIRNRQQTFGDKTGNECELCCKLNQETDSK